MSPISARRFSELVVAYIGVAAGIIGLVAAVTSVIPWATAPGKQTLEERIRTLTKSLNDSAALISVIEQEVDQRQQLVVKLQADAAEAEKLKALSADQVAAVAQALHGQLQSESRSAFWPSILTNLFFAFLGAGIGEGFRWVRLWRLRRQHT
jgi:hypothetical protein